jgi:HSP20 family protein
MSPRNLISWRPNRTEKPRRAEAASQQDAASASAAWMEPMERFFKSFFHDFRLDPADGHGRDAMGWAPGQVVLAEHGKELRLTVLLPGLSERDIEVKLTGDLLVLGGSREHAAEAGQPQAGRRYVSFYRSLKLPPGFVRDDIRAEIRDGVLTLRMPTTEASRRARRAQEAAKV